MGRGGGADSLGSAGISAAGAVSPLTATGSGAGDSSLAGAAFLPRDTLSRGLGGWASSGAVLSALGGRPLRAFTAVCSFPASGAVCSAFSAFGGRPRRDFFCSAVTSSCGFSSVVFSAAFASGMGSTGSTAGASTSGAAGSAFSTVSRAAARRSAISSSILSKDTTTSPGSAIVAPACSCWGTPAVKSGDGASVPGISVTGASGAIASPSVVGIFLFSSTC